MFKFDRLIDLCAEKNITVSQLERELGLGTSTISKWKNSQSPGIKNIVAIAEYFNVSVDYLSGKSDIRLTADDLLEDEQIRTITRIYSESNSKKRAMLMKILELKFDDYFDD